MYKILCSAMGYDEGKSGISSYINEVIFEISKVHRVDLLILKRDLNYFPLKPGKNLNFITYPDFLSKPVINMLWHLFWLPFSINSKGYDFVFLPAANRRLFCKNNITTLATFHDLSQFNIPTKYDSFRMLYIKKIIPHYLKKVDTVITVSENTKKDLRKFYRFPESKISVIHNGYKAKNFSPLKTAQGYNSLPDKKPYFLYVARIEHPGKNHLNLIKAYEKLPNEIKNKYNLVLAGSDWNGADTVHNYAGSSTDSKKIHFLGFATNDALPELYREASLYIFPSLYEGFGIPMLEAMASGIPVICSNNSSLPEIGQDAVVTFNPDSAADIAEKINTVINSVELQKSMITKGHERVKEFSWEKHAQRIIQEYERLK